MENNDNKLEMIKIGCFGESSVGKTCFARKYVKCDSEFDLSTVGVEYFITNKTLSDGKKYKIKIYDTAGQERYRSLCLGTIRGCDGIILMYDITRKNTFDLISQWIENINQLKENCPLVIVGNKCDLEDKRKVTKEEGLEIAKNYKTVYFDSSAKQGINVENTFEELINRIIHNINLEKEKNVNIKLEKGKKNKQKKRGKFC